MQLVRLQRSVGVDVADGGVICPCQSLSVPSSDGLRVCQLCHVAAVSRGSSRSIGPSAKSNGRGRNNEAASCPFLDYFVSLRHRILIGRRHGWRHNTESASLHVTRASAIGCTGKPSVGHRPARGKQSVPRVWGRSAETFHTKEFDPVGIVGTLMTMHLTPGQSQSMPPLRLRHPAPAHSKSAARSNIHIGA